MEEYTYWERKSKIVPQSLHTDKINDEKNAFVQELYETIVSEHSLHNGDLKTRALSIHKIYMTFYIMSHFKPKELDSPYFNNLLSCVIESESLFFLGFKNSGMMLLRSALELSFKFLYFAYHPIEQIKNETGNFDLHGIEYREFLYTFPNFLLQTTLNKDLIEQLWSELCQYTHCDVKTVDEISLIADIKPIFENEHSFQEYLKKIKHVFRIIITILFMVKSNWLEGVEKSYFDYPFEILFSAPEITDLKINLRIV